MSQLNIRDLPDMEERIVFFNSLYREHYKELFRFVYRAQLQKDVMAAEDIVQSTFCEAWNKLDMLETHPNVSGWLITTARNKILNKIKKFSSSEMVFHEYSEEPSYTESEYNVLELQMIVDKALTPEEKKLFIRYFIEKTPLKVMAEQEKMTVSAFKVRMHRIRKKVQEQLDD